MAYSGTIDLTVFNANDLVDTAFRRCRLPAQAITGEMQEYALKALYLLLSELPNARTLSWCIDRVVLPMYVGQPAVPMPVGTVDLLNLNYRTNGVVSPTVETAAATTYTLEYSTSVTITTIGATYSGTTTTVNVQTSPDGVTWTTVSTMDGGVADEQVWQDLVPPVNTQYIRLQNGAALNVSAVTACNNPSEIPMGPLNRDTYVAQSNKVFEGRPTTYWFQRDIPRPDINLWPAPNDSAAQTCQLIAWRQRHVMDVAALRQDVEVPRRWLDAIAWGLADRVGVETPAVDMAVLPLIQARAAQSLMRAYEGDSDGAPTQIMPQISGYTR